MKQVFMASLATLAITVSGCATSLSRHPAGDGPGSGGGTDLKKVRGSAPVLMDYANSWNEQEIDPRDFEGIYTHVQPKLERLNYYFPGIEDELEKTFKKDWRLTDEVFKPNHANEIKPIKQSVREVKINRKYLADPNTAEIQKQQDWLHELVRGYVNEYVKVAVITSSKNLQEDSRFNRAIDTIVRTITPLIFDERPIDILAKNWTGTLAREYEDKYFPKDSHLADFGFMTGRQQMYDGILAADLAKRYHDFCEQGGNWTELLAAAIANKDQYYRKGFFDSGEKTAPDRTRKLYRYAVDGQISNDFGGALGRAHNVYHSEVMNAVGLFAARSTSAIEGVALAGVRLSPEINLYDQNTDTALDLDTRARLLKFACEHAPREIMVQTFAEYESDHGEVHVIKASWQH